MMNKMLAIIGLFLSTGTSVAAQEAYTGRDIVRAAIDNCVSASRVGRFAQNENLYFLKDPVLSILKRDLRLPENVRVLTPEHAKWFMVEHLREPANQCIIYSSSYTGMETAVLWNSHFPGQSMSFRTDGERSEPRKFSNGGWRTYGFAASPVENGFIQVFLNTFSVAQADQPVTVIDVMRVPKTPASCEIWPEECGA